MNDKMKSVWLDIEQKIGKCCLHKKAAFHEVAGMSLQSLDLATTASESVIKAFLGDIKYELTGERYRFNYKGVQVDLTAYEGTDDLITLHERIFRHTMTIDSIGVTSNGRITDLYNGVDDIHRKVLRMTSEDTAISEVLMKRILTLISNGYTLDKELEKRFDTEKIFEKSGYRKKLIDVIISLSKSGEASSERIARIIRAVNVIEHRKLFADYLVSHDSNLQAGTQMTEYLFLIFALMKVTSKELAPFMQGEKLLGFYDSVCANLNKKPKTYTDYVTLKENYGEPFMDILFDIQEMFASVEGIPYKRPSQKDFDLMSQLISDDRFWGVREEKPAEDVEEDDDEDESFELEGTLDVAKAMSGEYSEEDYSEETEGVEEDTYVMTEEREQQDFLDADPINASHPTQKKEICVDDEPPKAKDDNGMNEDGLKYYEAEVKQRKSTVSAPIAPLPKKEPEAPHRTHKSKLLTDGGE